MSPRYQPKNAQITENAPDGFVIRFPKGTDPGKARILCARIEKFLAEGRPLETLILEHW